MPRATTPTTKLRWIIFALLLASTAVLLGAAPASAQSNPPRGMQGVLLATEAFAPPARGSFVEGDPEVALILAAVDSIRAAYPDLAEHEHPGTWGPGEVAVHQISLTDFAPSATSPQLRDFLDDLREGCPAAADPEATPEATTIDVTAPACSGPWAPTLREQGRFVLTRRSADGRSVFYLRPAAGYARNMRQVYRDLTEAIPVLSGLERHVNGVMRIGGFARSIVGQPAEASEDAGFRLLFRTAEDGCPQCGEWDTRLFEVTPIASPDGDWRFEIELVEASGSPVRLP
jgi:hypothetical protein